MTVAVYLSVDDARRLTERIRLKAMTAKETLTDLQSLVEQAREQHVDHVLGYPSWTAYLADVFGDAPLRLEREQRAEIVGYLAGEGMSTRAIAAVVDIPKSTVSDIKARLSGSGQSTPATVTSLDGRQRPSTQPERINPRTGEVVPPPVFPATDVTDWTPEEVDEQLEADEWERQAWLGSTIPAPVAPPVVIQHPAMPARTPEQENAEQAAQTLARTCVLLAGLDHERMRTHYRDSWQRGLVAVSPAQREAVTPETMRRVAAGLNALADEWSTR